MKLCFIGDPRSVHTQRWVRWFAPHHEVVFISTAPDHELAEFRVCELPTSAKPGMRLLSSVQVVRNVLAEERPDIVHAHYINEAGWFASAARRRPFVITAWGSDLYRAPSESMLARRLNPWALRTADWVTCDSEDQAGIVRSWGVSPERVSVIGWGIDRSEFHPGVDGSSLRERSGLPADAPVLLSPRQWLPNSNIEAIVEAHARLPEDTYLLLKRISRFERDGGRTGIDDAISASPARDRIRVLDEIPAADLPALYAAADVVVSLGTTDGTPMSVLEAMAIGRPVVALRTASLAEWLSEPGGRLMPSTDSEDVAKAVGDYLSDRDLRERAAASNTEIVERRANRSKEMARMNEIYTRLTPAESNR